MTHNVSLNVLCFPFQIGKVKITIFHLLVACTFVFTYLWGYIIYNTIIKNDQVDTKLLAAKPVPTVHDGEIVKQQILT